MDQSQRRDGAAVPESLGRDPSPATELARIGGRG